MVFDASAVIAILFEETQAAECMDALQSDMTRVISAVNSVEDRLRLWRDHAGRER